MAERTYNTRGLDFAVDSFIEGRKFKQDEAYRQAMKDIAQAENRRAADQFDIQQGGYRKSNFDEAGNYLNREKNAENILQSQPIQEALDPSSYGVEVNPGTPAMPDPSVAAEENAIARRIQQRAIEDAKRMGEPTDSFMEPKSPGAPAIAPSTQPQQIGASQPLAKALAPSPLLKSKDVAKQEEENAYLRDTNLNPELNIPHGTIARNASGQLVSDLNQKRDFVDKVVPGNDLEDKIIPATPAVRKKFNPTPEQMALIDKKIFQKTEKDNDYWVDLATDLDATTKAQLGLDPNATGRMKFSMLKVLAEAGLKQKKLQIDDLTYGLADQVRKGSSLGSVLRTFRGSVGREPNEREFDLLSGQSKAGDIDDRAAKTAARLEKEKRNVIVRTLQKDIYTAAKDDIGAIAAATTLKNLVSKKNTAGFEGAIVTSLMKMSGQASNSMSDKDAKAFGGLSGWENQVNAFISKAQGEGLNDLEKKRVLDLAEVFINSARRNFKNKTSYFRRSAIPQMEQYTQSIQEAQAMIDRASDPDVLVREFEEPIPAEPKNKGTGSGKNWNPSKQQQLGLMDLQKRTTSKLREIDARPNLSKEEKEMLKNKVKDRFLILTKPYTEDGSGIPWGK